MEFHFTNKISPMSKLHIVLKLSSSWGPFGCIPIIACRMVRKVFFMDQVDAKHRPIKLSSTFFRLIPTVSKGTRIKGGPGPHSARLYVRVWI